MCTTGARLIKILYSKYVVQHGWRLQLHPVPAAAPPAAAAAAAVGDGGPTANGPYGAVLAFLDAVLELITSQVSLGGSTFTLLLGLGIIGAGQKMALVVVPSATHA